VNEPISLVLFSGTDDKLHAAATIVAGASAMGRPVNMLVQFWALDAFCTDHIALDHGLAFDAVRPGSTRTTATATRSLPWAETFRQAKELGEVRIRACSASMDYLGIRPEQLDPLVDDVCGIASFFLDADSGPLVFI
jgi:peroxiredoxin family protein